MEHTQHDIQFKDDFWDKHCVKSVQIESFSGLYFPVFSPNTGKQGPEKTPYLDTFHIVQMTLFWYLCCLLWLDFMECSDFSIGDFEQVNNGWQVHKPNISKFWCENRINAVLGQIY